MLKFRPERYYVSVLDIDPADIAALGYKAVLLDVDNTLLPRGYDEVPEKIVRWVELVQEAGLSVALVSNSTGSRAPQIAEALKLPIIAGAFKPFISGYVRACAMLGIAPRDALMIGDQSYTDVLGAHRIGMDAFMVMPLNENEPLHTYLLRMFDRKVVKGMRAQGSVS